MSVVSLVRSFPPAQLSATAKFAPRGRTEHVAATHRHLLRFEADIFEFGERLHEAFHEHNRRGTCEPSCYGWVRSLRSWLSATGAKRIKTEWQYFPRDGMPSGKLDLFASKSDCTAHVIEVKAALQCGYNPNPAHLSQAAHYAALVSAWNRLPTRKVSISICYACVRTKRWSIHTWRRADLVVPHFVGFRAG